MATSNDSTPVLEQILCKILDNCDSLESIERMVTDPQIAVRAIRAVRVDLLALALQSYDEHICEPSRTVKT